MTLSESPLHRYFCKACIRFLQAQAIDMGCEAIVGLNFQPSAVSEALAGQCRDITYGAVFFAYCTAVKLKLR